MDEPDETFTVTLSVPSHARWQPQRRLWQPNVDDIRHKYLLAEHAKWAKRFSDEFYMVPGVREKLEKLNPKTETGHRRARHHQWLTDNVGHTALQKHISGVMALMRASTRWDHFTRLLQRSYPKINTNLELPIDYE